MDKENNKMIKEENVKGTQYTIGEEVFTIKDETTFTSKQWTRKPLEGVELLIDEKCDDLKHMLLRKNQQYGDSALNPIRIFSTSSTDEQLRVRIDDKLSRLSRGDDSLESDNDIINDLIGYSVLLSIHKDLHQNDGETN